MKVHKKIILFILLIVILLGLLLIFKTNKNTFRLTKPISVYITWGAHDNLSDTISLSEKLVIKQLYTIHALKKVGAQFDYFVLDAGWADTMSSCRKFNAHYWPNGPKKWIKACEKEKLLPGLWFPINLTGLGNTKWMKIHPSWTNSKVNAQTLSLSEGNYLRYHIQTFQYWYNQGIRLFKLDFAFFNVPSKQQKNEPINEIISANEEALYKALLAFKEKNKDAIFLAYNGFGGELKDTYPVFDKTIQTKWLDVFESLYSGDPRPSDIPCSNFWRSKDIYSDHMVRQFQFNGIPLNRIDNSSFMIGNTGTCYKRQKAAWKSTFLLSLIRGGWVNTYYGDLSLLNTNEKHWFSKAQSFWLSLQKNSSISTLGDIPGTGKVYGYCSENSKGKVVTLVNPSQTIQYFNFPDIKGKKLVLYYDNGETPIFQEHKIAINPEQMVIVGCKKYSDKKYQLGQYMIENKINRTKKIFSKQTQELSNHLTLNYFPKNTKKLKIIFSLKDKVSRPIRVTGGSPPNGEFLSEILKINISQNKRKIYFQTNSKKQIWSGMSWILAEINKDSYISQNPIKISFNILEKYSVKAKITCTIYEISD